MKQLNTLLLITVVIFLSACAQSRDARNISYTVEGQTITLQGGRAEQLLASDSASRSVWHYVGDAAHGDLNGDGVDDWAQLLVNDSGGSGTFYYVSVALAEGQDYRGTNALLLGDRIAPQRIEIDKGIITVNYAERVAGAALAEIPTVNVTKYFKVKDGSLYRTYVISQISHRKWRWLHTQMNDDKRITPRQPEAFTLVLREDGVVMGTSDCNRFSGSYTSTDNKLTFGHFAATRMFCEGAQEADFLKQLGEVDNYLLDNEGRLLLQLKLDSGAIIFAE